jgi:hypothetical protein
MHLIDRLSKAQRVAVVVALGLALAGVGSYLVSLDTSVRTGYYIRTNAVAPPLGTDLPAWVRLIIWLALIGLWALASVRVLRPAPENVASA